MRKSLSRLGRSSSKAGDGKSGAGEGGAQLVYAFQPNEDAWVLSDKEGADGERHLWDKAKVLTHSGVLLTVRIQGQRAPSVIDTRVRGAYPMNPKVEADCTALYHINEPSILHNLEQRSYDNEPYTSIGSVLVSVNPLKRIKDPKGALGTRKATLEPHPYGIAEIAFQQMSFAADNRKRPEEGVTVNQSIIASGESGAGKTECAKMALKHLVQRTMGGSSSHAMHEIDSRLLESNLLTEAFGNAKTLRNNNSSRFGKFMKLHFQQQDTARGTEARWAIAAGSVDTYLLERSRVSLHDAGERNFHIFYFLLAGMDKATAKTKLHFGLLKASGWRYLAPLKSALQVDVPASETKYEMLKDDKERFLELEKAMRATGMTDAECMAVFRVTAGVMHLGNVGFGDEETTEGDVARPEEVEAGYDPIDCAADLFGVDAGALERLLLETTLHTRDGDIVVHRNSSAASFTRDAVAKGLYSALFDHVIDRINIALDETSSGSDREELPFIGVLDIFGFESFKRNGFEQLLINYTNESLQGTFNKKIFQSELKLYKDEGLILDSVMTLPPGNEPAMALLAGKRKHPNSEDDTAREAGGMLVDLDRACRELKPSDKQMLKGFQKAYAAHPNFLKVHPKNAHEQFKVKHYAGVVAYTVGNWIEKNNDSLPKEVNELFAAATSPVLAPIFAARAQAQAQAAKAGGGHAKPKPRSIVKNFRAQILELQETLDSTACTFIRCVKPNASMQRGNNKSWFDRSYVAHQLKHLSIPQTATVLRSGLPTRIAYNTLVETYMGVLPADATRRFRNGSGKGTNGKLFVAALFWSFEIAPGSFKMGHTKVFFKAGQIAELDRVLQEAALWDTSKDPKVQKERKKVSKRFRKYYARLMWRRALAKVVAINIFTRMLVQRKAALVIQQAGRAYVARRELAMRAATQHDREEREAAERKAAAEREAELERLADAEHEKLSQELKRQKTLAAKTRAALAAAEEEEDEADSQSGDDMDGMDEGTREERDRAKEIAASRRHQDDRSPLKRAQTTRFGYDDDDDDDDNEDGGDSDTDGDEEKFAALEEESEDERRARLAGEIQEDAERATEKKIAKLEAEGEVVTEGDREEILHHFEKQYTAHMARFEARRQRTDAFKADVSKFWVDVGANSVKHTKLFWSDVAHKVVHHGPKLLLPGVRKKVEEHPNYHHIKKKVVEIHANLRDGQEDPQVKAAMEDVAEQIEGKEKESQGQGKGKNSRKPVGRALAAQGGQGAGAGQLKKMETMMGTAVQIAPSEMETPTESARQQVASLKTLLESGAIDEGELVRLVRDIGKALDRRSSRKYSQVSDEDDGVQVLCSECGTTGNTINGALCKNCNHPLQVSARQQRRAFRSPAKDRWEIKRPLHYRDGDFYVRMRDEVKTRFNAENFSDEKIFLFECAWQDHKDPALHARWVVEITGFSLGALAKILQSKKAAAFKSRKVTVPEFPLDAKAQAAKKKAAGAGGSARAAKLFNFRRTSKQRELPHAPSRRALTLEKYIGKVQDWITSVVDLAAGAGKGKGDDPIFKVAFEEYFEVQNNVHDLVAQYKDPSL